MLRTWRPHKTMNYPSNCRRNLAPQKNQGVVSLQKWTTCLAALKSFKFETLPCFRFSGIKMHSYSFTFAAFGWHLIPFVFGKHTNLPLENTLNSSTTAPVPTLSNRSVLAGVIGCLWCFVFFFRFRPFQAVQNWGTQRNIKYGYHLQKSQICMANHNMRNPPRCTKEWVPIVEKCGKDVATKSRSRASDKLVVFLVATYRSCTRDSWATFDL